MNKYERQHAIDGHERLKAVLNMGIDLYGIDPLLIALRDICHNRVITAQVVNEKEGYQRDESIMNKWELRGDALDEVIGLCAL